MQKSKFKAGDVVIVKHIEAPDEFSSLMHTIGKLGIIKQADYSATMYEYFIEVLIDNQIIWYSEEELELVDTKVAKVLYGL